MEYRHRWRPKRSSPGSRGWTETLNQCVIIYRGKHTDLAIFKEVTPSADGHADGTDEVAEHVGDDDEKQRYQEEIRGEPAGQTAEDEGERSQDDVANENALELVVVEGDLDPDERRVHDQVQGQLMLNKG